jgi:hypothetical protein
MHMAIPLPANYETLTIEQRREVRNAYITLQGGLCHYCKAPLSGPPPEEVRKKRINRSLFPPTFFVYPVHLHHHHETGQTIGAVHNYCNAVLFCHHDE